MTEPIEVTDFDWMERVGDDALRIADAFPYWRLSGDAKAAKRNLIKVLNSKIIFMGPSEQVAADRALKDASDVVTILAKDYCVSDFELDEKESALTVVNSRESIEFLNALRSHALFQWQLRHGLGGEIPSLFEASKNNEKSLKALAYRLSVSASIEMLSGHIRFCAFTSDPKARVQDFLDRFLATRRRITSEQHEAISFWKAEPEDLTIGRKRQKVQQNPLIVETEKLSRSLLDTSKSILSFMAFACDETKHPHREVSKTRSELLTKGDPEEGQYVFDALVGEATKCLEHVLSRAEFEAFLNTELHRNFTETQGVKPSGVAQVSTPWVYAWRNIRLSYIEARNASHPLPIWLKVLGPVFNAPTYLLRRDAPVSTLRHVHDALRIDVSREGEFKHERLSQLCLAGLFVALFYELTLTGRLTGQGPAGMDARKHLLHHGWNSNSIRGDIPLIKFGFAGNFVAISASLAEVIETLNEADAQAITANLVLSIYEAFNLGLKPIDFCLIIASSLGESPAYNLVPERAINPQLRETLNTLKDSVNTVRSRVAGFSEYAPGRRNVFGAPVMPEAPRRAAGLERPVDSIERLIDEQMEQAGVRLALPGRVQDGRVISDETQDELTRISGKAVKSAETGASLKDILFEASYLSRSGRVKDPATLFRAASKKYRDEAKKHVSSNIQVGSLPDPALSL